MDKLNLLSFTQAELDNFFSEIGEKPYRSKQIMSWIYHKNEFNFDNMLNFSKQLRDKLNAIATLSMPRVISQHNSTDGVIKWLIDVGAKNHIETVYIPDKHRSTLCISSQVGCSLACSFCATGMQGFNRNLTTAEIISQVLIVNKYLEKSQRRVSNIVFMGMGEPLLNEKATYAACDLFLDDLAFGLSRRKVTISTSGVVPALYRMTQKTPVSLAVSLHAATDDLRDELVPINKKYPIKDLLVACKNYINSGTQERHILFEYVMLNGVNDTKEHAIKLAKLLTGIKAKVNLIPFNDFDKSEYTVSKQVVIEQFMDVLHDFGIRVMIRRVRGDDIDGACGQLAGSVVDKSGRIELC